jgi:hypothetical protein
LSRPGAERIRTGRHRIVRARPCQLNSRLTASYIDKSVHIALQAKVDSRRLRAAVTRCRERATRALWLPDRGIRRVSPW